MNFIVPKGWTVGLLGGNGAGKTTTIAMIMGLVVPTVGRAMVLGHDMATERHKVLKRMNFESPYVALPARLTVRENLNVFGRLYGVPNVKARIEELIEEFELGDILDRVTGRLSAGQKTRVSVAKALINDPDVLVLDEPTASLDPDRAEWVRSRLQAYRQRSGATILLSSHNMLEVEQLCDFVVIMSRGRVVAMGTPRELVEQLSAGTSTRPSSSWRGCRDAASDRRDPALRDRPISPGGSRSAANAARHRGARKLLDAAFGPGRFAKSSERLREGRVPARGLAFTAFEGGA